MKNIAIVLFILLNFTLIAQEKSDMKKKVNKTEAEWKEILTDQQYYVLREKGTDRPGDSGYTKHFEKGTYHCAACDAQLFESGTKYESHCGWPSFDDAIKGSVEITKDTSLGMIRTEITCTNCGGHLGHIFDDGPKDTTGKRYCVNTTSIKFKSQ
jgi:peptide-methionine (R)-S-oxide reductase